MSGVVFQGLDTFDIISFIVKKNKRFQAIFLNELKLFLLIQNHILRLESFILILKITIHVRSLELSLVM